MTWREELRKQFNVSGDSMFEQFIEQLLEKKKEEYESKINELGCELSKLLTIPQNPEIGITIIAEKYSELFFSKGTGFGLNPKEGE